VLEAMRTHAVERVQQTACGALHNFAARRVQSAEEACRAGALNLVLAAMHAHGSNENLHQHGCGFLARACSVPPLCARARDSGAADVLNAALARFPESAVASKARLVLAKLAAAHA
jgi:hypothetical protein